MALCRYILFNTTSLQKVKEITTSFIAYDIHIKQITINLKSLSHTEIIELIINSEKENSGHRNKCIGIITENTQLIRKNIGDYIHLEEVQHYSKLDYYHIIDDAVIVNDFTSITYGFIDLTKLRKDKRIYGWDDIFVVFNSFMSYLEALESGQKISSRDINVSKFIEKYIHYKNRKDLVYKSTTFHSNN